ncbi:hypothetical protein F0562_002887 [Nyssa sinensis]|uniref:RNase H type-1 domain-containing protein n=1 Tax=Nyssa sinensis TaxID=561372 RepID=A0A5J5BUR6_9ASTE|nr:hypothetical protein F0562_002887 [Nyssa sinensis]
MSNGRSGVEHDESSTATSLTEFWSDLWKLKLQLFLWRCAAWSNLHRKGVRIEAAEQMATKYALSLDDSSASQSSIFLFQSPSVLALWIPPPTLLKLNVDGAWKNEVSSSGIGAVVRNEQGLFIAAMAMNKIHVANPLIMEAYAIF